MLCWLLLLTLYPAIPIGQSQNTLAIAGPIAAFEGDAIAFTITLDGNPIQARVLFDGDHSTGYSNATTGTITLTMPTVSNEGHYFTIEATLPGNLSTTHTIFVKNITSLLRINHPTTPIIETQPFTITITDGITPISNAIIQFNSLTYTTNTNGEAQLLAPDVLVTTTYGIKANKTGYLQNTTMITVTEAGLGTNLMSIISPYIVEPDHSDIPVTIIGTNGGIPNVTISVYYQETKQAEYLTNSEGKISITSPMLAGENYFTLTCSKNNYTAQDGTNTCIIQLQKRSYPTDLQLSLTPSEVYEGNRITIHVTDDSGKPVSGTAIYEEGIILDETTDEQGTCIVLAPSTPFDREYSFYVTKTNYNFDEQTLTLRSTHKKTLLLNLNTSIQELEPFTLTVTDTSYIPIPTAQVTFNSHTQQTDTQGQVQLIAPEVSADTYLKIYVEKNGYIPAIQSIQIKNSDPTASAEKLIIHVQPKILTGETFNITITKGDNTPVENAQVTFSGTTQYTNTLGSVIFTAPQVTWDETQTIQVTKAGYTSASTSITVVSAQGFSYWPIVLIITVIILIGVIVYFKYNRYRY
jgi:hypothetical protein